VLKLDGPSFVRPAGCSIWLGILARTAERRFWLCATPSDEPIYEEHYQSSTDRYPDAAQIEHLKYRNVAEGEDVCTQGISHNRADNTEQMIVPSLCLPGIRNFANAPATSPTQNHACVPIVKDLPKGAANQFFAGERPE
jgi:hypothetical protein